MMRKRWIWSVLLLALSPVDVAAQDHAGELEPSRWVTHFGVQAGESGPDGPSPLITVGFLETVGQRVDVSWSASLVAARAWGACTLGVPGGCEEALELVVIPEVGLRFHSAHSKVQPYVGASVGAAVRSDVVGMWSVQAGVTAGLTRAIGLTVEVRERFEGLNLSTKPWATVASMGLEFAL